MVGSSEFLEITFSNSTVLLMSDHYRLYNNSVKLDISQNWFTTKLIYLIYKKKNWHITVFSSTWESVLQLTLSFQFFSILNQNKVFLLGTKVPLKKLVKALAKFFCIFPDNNDHNRIWRCGTTNMARTNCGLVFFHICDLILCSTSCT